MKIQEMRGLSPAELAKAVEEARQELFNLRLRLATRQLDNFRELRKTRKKIARLKTVLGEKEMGVR